VQCRLHFLIVPAASMHAEPVVAPVQFRESFSRILGPRETLKGSRHRPPHEDVIQTKGGYQYAQREDKGPRVRTRMVVASERVGDEGRQQDHTDTVEQAEDQHYWR
jgi:hypothetical protein